VSANARFQVLLEKAGFQPAQAPAPMGLYAPFVISDNHVHLSGVTPRDASGDHPWRGEVGKDLGVDQARQAASLAAINLVANLASACGQDLDRVAQVVMLRGFVIAAPDFGEVPSVIDGASEVLLEVFGDPAGRPARTSIGVAALPDRVTVELDALVRFR